jgi:hypothetical protein
MSEGKVTSGPTRDPFREQGQAATDQDRSSRRRVELRGRLDQLERAEEVIIELVAAQGQDIGRRPDASPACVLGIRIVGAVPAPHFHVVAPTRYPRNSAGKKQ